MKRALRFPCALLFCMFTHNAAAATWYVATNGEDGAAGTNWPTAKQTIQAGVDTAQMGDTVLVSNGVYATGGVANYPSGGALTNRVAIYKPITVCSVNGSDFTTIQGANDLLTTGGYASVRCVYMTNGASLVGFTLNGATRNTSGNADGDGGGAWCESTAAVISNCLLSGNWAKRYGGGALCGTLYNCTLASNSAARGGGAGVGTLYNCTLVSNSAQYGGGSWSGLLNNCTLAGNSASIFGGGSCQDTLTYCMLSNNWAGMFGGGASEGTLNNCVLTGNAAGSGGGVSGGALSNCMLVGNSAQYSGGGSSGSTLNNCALVGNSASDGGGSSGSTLNSCTLTGNSASQGGGSAESTLTNCIAYFNTASFGPNYWDSTLGYSCTTPEPEGTGNITNEPGLASASHVAVGSPCVGAGSSAYVSGADIDGDSWLNPPSMGCDELVAGSITGALNVGAWAAETNVLVGFPIQFRADIFGRTTASVWLWGDGSASSNQPYATHAFPSGSVYAVVLRAYNESYPLGVAATVTVMVAAQMIHYVNISNAAPVSPYDSWATAATNIQDAIDRVSQNGALVLVSNGVYATGGRVVFGSMTNRVVITKLITVQSVNGPAVTVIEGAQDPETTNGDAAVRCVCVTTNAVLSGFMLTHGATRAKGDSAREQSGGGAWCEGVGTLDHCILTGNSSIRGGGATGGTLNDCSLTGNSASQGGGSYGSTLNRCSLTGNSATNGGGAHSCTLYDCTLTGNSVSFRGGGTYYGTLRNCALASNSADCGGGASRSALYNCTLDGNFAGDRGGGAEGGTLFNCTLSGNRGENFGGGASSGTLYNCTLVGNVSWNGGGSDFCTLRNCIVFSNSAANYYGGDVAYCCATPLPSGEGNITNDPQFVNATGRNYHLKAGSPCTDKGSNLFAQGTVDLDGNPRILNGIVDMGAYEYQYNAGYWAWAGAITNGLTNFGDCATGDGYPNLLKFATGSSPTNSDSLARLLGGQALVFNRNTNAVDVTLIVEGASAVTNNAKWNGIATNINGSWGGATNVAEAGATNPVTVTVQDPNPATNRFLRLRVSRP